MKDLVVLVADQDAHLGIRSLLERPVDLGVRRISFDIFRHVNRDNGVFQQAHDFLRAQSTRYQFALSVCDLQGCGREHLPRVQVESSIEMNLAANGWHGRSAAIVIEPELESWFWGDWVSVKQHTGWSSSATNLRDWLVERRLVNPGQDKPTQPKEVLEKVLRQNNKPHSSALFGAMGQSVDPAVCVDPAFVKFRSILQHWFPIEGIQPL